ncbi:RNA polymerase sigma-70 factor, ECF subfamily [Desulfoscipio geothermicus DSM 3669]|uniref:RNA polymerase sigma-70 factor, ECF subfamily n=1 Tax=Desulfoscipio geothermicus DSM 3669 TaxID=1121426 RepID=A0A1I6E9X6_9FIRM|nr:RNA polymerase sigma-70 factor, ECF subfamily [Desulfoscipio geothermicus DSM 3669]
MTVSTIEKLYRDYRVGVFRYLYRMGGDCHLAEELTQETFYRACVSLKNFHGESTLSTWLYRIAFYVYTGYLRGHPRDRHLPLDRNIPDRGRTGNPDRALEDAENRRLAGEALHRLPETYRAVIILRELEEMSFAEIGAVLNKSPSTVRVILFRARQKYRQLFNQLADGKNLL